MSLKLLLATTNDGKIREIKEIFRGLQLEIVTMDDLGMVINVRETGKTFEENAIIKAKTVGGKTGLLTLGEDSGLEVDILGGKPGIYSARYCEGTDKDRNDKLLGELEGIPKNKRIAGYKAVVAIYNPEKKQVSIYEGESKGYITEKPFGANGFGYDPIFYNFDLKKTNGEASFVEKNKVSHRSRALVQLKEKLLKILTSSGR